VVVVLRPATRSEALRTMDDIEGVTVDLFRRVEIRTGTGMVAWSYEWVGHTKGMDTIDSWA
jgi:gamma-glutamylcyclotransferase (GGCT)/AIG2-like uncharacterized protein YtfP